MSKKPSILAISLGGTLFMASSDDNIKSAQVLGDRYYVFSDFPKVEQIVEPKFVELSSIDSSNLQRDDWKKVAEYIIAHKDKYDGFVVLQGTDTLAYSASALSFALLGLNKPVVLTGAQKGKDDIGSDAQNNVINAFQVAALRHKGQPALKEVVIVFGTKLIKGTRARKYSERDLESFDTVNTPLLGRIRLQVKIKRNLVLHETKESEEFGINFNSGVNMLYIYPGIDPKIVLQVGQNSSALILAAFGAGNIPCTESNLPNNPYSLEKVVATLTRQNIPVVITTQCVTGQAEFSMYEAGHAARNAGAIIANDMTPETAYVKMSWILANEQFWPNDAKRAARGGPGWLEGVKKAMISNMVGEITENPVLNSCWE